MSTDNNTLASGRVTAGLPSLDPPKRFRHAHAEGLREREKTIITETEAKREAALAPDGKRPTHLYEAQRGLELDASHIMTRLRILNPNLWFERSLAIPDIMGIYMEVPGVGRKFVCGFESGRSPEFEVREYQTEETVTGYGENKKLETVKVCTGTKRGWRTVLQVLIKGGVITQAGAEKMFGPPTHDSRLWQKGLA